MTPGEPSSFVPPSGSEILAAAKTIDGRQRFYPPYQHPACARLVCYLRELEGLEGVPGVDEINLATAKGHTLDQLARFEYAENLEKLAYIDLMRRRAKRRHDEQIP